MNTQQRWRNAVVAAGVAAIMGASALTVAVADSTDSSASVGAAITDTAITAKVKTKLATDSRLHGSDVSVETNNGVVTLTGSATTASAKRAAEELAENVSGVHSVNNQVEAPSATSEVGSSVKSAAKKTARAVSDTTITAKLKTKYGADSRLKGADVSVTTSHGVVALSGSVVSQAQKNHVVYVAKHTDGVAQVDTTALNINQ
jgi:hyperosmotically inducible periplasmic protein